MVVALMIELQKEMRKMIDIAKISGEHISKLAGAYLHAAFVFGAEPIEASKVKQQKIRKWIINQYIELVHELPEKANIFSSENSDKDVLLFLKECVDLGKSKAKEKENKFEVDFTVVDEAAKSALKKLLELEFWPKIKVVGDDIKIITDDTPAFRRILTLKNADAVPMGKEGYYCQNLGMVLKKEQNRFCFYGELQDPVEELAIPFALTFENAEAEVEIYNSCNNMTFLENPWDLLRTISFEIGIKADLPGDYCNAKEKELLPLVKEIVALEYWIELPEQEFFSFGELKRLSQKYSYSKVERLLGNLETIKPSNNSFYKTVKKLIAILCKKHCEPLWREIYNKIVESQAEYPNKVDSLCDKELLMIVRNDIQTLMESKGYVGIYPDFVNDGSLNGIHLEHSYNMTYFLGMEKKAQYYIHCSESFEENDYLTIQFICGTAFLKKDEEEKEIDIYHCLFNAKGRRLFHIVQHYIPLQDEENTKADDLETSVTIAVKKAECIKLTKAEQKEYYGKMIPGWGLFWWVFLIGGGMFGIAMTLIMMLLCIITTAVFGLFADIPEMLKTMPWGLLLAIGWIGFGGAMGIIEVLVHRK